LNNTLFAILVLFFGTHIISCAPNRAKESGALNNEVEEEFYVHKIEEATTNIHSLNLRGAGHPLLKYEVKLDSDHQPVQILHKHLMPILEKWGLGVIEDLVNREFKSAERYAPWALHGVYLDIISNGKYTPPSTESIKSTILGSLAKGECPPDLDDTIDKVNQRKVFELWANGKIGRKEFGDNFQPYGVKNSVLLKRAPDINGVQFKTQTHYYFIEKNLKNIVNFAITASNFYCYTEFTNKTYPDD
jgi:hypothetical protein